MGSTNRQRVVYDFLIHEARPRIDTLMIRNDWISVSTQPRKDHAYVTLRQEFEFESHQPVNVKVPLGYVCVHTGKCWQGARKHFGHVSVWRLASSKHFINKMLCVGSVSMTTLSWKRPGYIADCNIFPSSSCIRSFLIETKLKQNSMWARTLSCAVSFSVMFQCHREEVWIVHPSTELTLSSFLISLLTSG